jgi:hypothetical protein
MARIALILVLIFAAPFLSTSTPQTPTRSYTFNASLDVPAGQADGSDNPMCPPAKCGWVTVRGIRPSSKGSGYACCTIQTYVGDHECQPVTNPKNIVNVLWWDCGSHYSRFYGPYQLSTEPAPPKGTGLGVVRVEFRNWASYSQRATIYVTFSAPPPVGPPPGFIRP